MATINLPFAASASRRIPTSGELADGYSCGPLDRGLDNWLEWWVTGQIKEAMAGASVAVDDTDLTRLSKAIASMAADGQCRLSYVSATQIRLDPYGGNLVRVAGAAVAIPSAGITAANTSVTINGVGSSNLAASTTYYVALNASGGLEFWTLATGRAKDTAAGNIGVEIISGQPTKSVVGMVATNASSQFAASSGFWGVISYFNRRDIGLIGVTTPASTTSSIGFVELHSPSRVFFLNWNDEVGSAHVLGQGHNGTTAFSVSTGVGLNGSFLGIAGGSYTASGGQSSYTGAASPLGLADGLHYVTPLGTVGAGGTGTFSVAALVNIRG